MSYLEMGLLAAYVVVALLCFGFWMERTRDAVVSLVLATIWPASWIVLLGARLGE